MLASRSAARSWWTADTPHHKASLRHTSAYGENAKIRTKVPIFAFSPYAEVCRRLALWWGVSAVHQDLAADLEANIEAMERYLVEHESVQVADTVVIPGSH